MDTKKAEYTPTKQAFAGRSLFCIMLSLVFIASIAAWMFFSTNAQAADEKPTISTALQESICQTLKSKFAEAKLGNATTLSYDTQAASEGFNASSTSSSTENSSASFDLRDSGRVTPVKLQNPWGTCWSFATCAAAETSILSAKNTTYEEYPIDLSERQLAWFSQTPIVDGAQAGEGDVSLVTTYPGSRLNTGGTAFTSASIFSAGIGPLAEDLAPYKNEEGTWCTYSDLLTDEQIASLKEQNPDFDPNATMSPKYYSPTGDWSVSEDLRFIQNFEMSNSNILPSPASITVDPADSTGQTKTYTFNEDGVKAFKSELSDGKAVAIHIYADQSKPTDSTNSSKYMNYNTWGYYAYNTETFNHVVTVVGWDDNYSKDNFVADHKPPENGAWIVKNSWGASTNEEPNKGDWGIDGSGYYYVSYYDQSIYYPETFDFNVTDEITADQYIIDSHSFMPLTQPTATDQDDDSLRMANVFCAEEDQDVRDISTMTTSPNTTTTFEVYILNEGYQSPTDGVLAARAQDTFTYSGFHRIHLENGVVIEKGQTYSVVLDQYNESTQKHQCVTCNSFNKEGSDAINAASPNSYPTYSVGVVNRGESYVYEAGAWSDYVDSIDAIKQANANAAYYAFDNFPIKAYADIIPTLKVTALEALEPITNVEAGTALTDIALPETASYTLEDNSVGSATVNWNYDSATPAYDPESTSEQTFELSGAVAYPNNVDGTDYPEAKIQISVNANQAEKHYNTAATTDKNSNPFFYIIGVIIAAIIIAASIAYIRFRQKRDSNKRE